MASRIGSYVTRLIQASPPVSFIARFIHIDRVCYQSPQFRYSVNRMVREIITLSVAIGRTNAVCFFLRAVSVTFQVGEYEGKNSYTMAR